MSDIIRNTALFGPWPADRVTMKVTTTPVGKNTDAFRQKESAGNSGPCQLLHNSEREMKHASAHERKTGRGGGWGVCVGGGGGGVPCCPLWCRSELELTLEVVRAKPSTASEKSSMSGWSSASRAPCNQTSQQLTHTTPTTGLGMGERGGGGGCQRPWTRWEDTRDRWKPCLDS